MVMFNKKEVKNENINNNTNKEKESVLSTVIVIIVSLLIAILSLCFFRLSEVDGHSMDNTLADGEKLIVNTYIYKNNDPKHGDIVVVERRDLSIRYFIKRVIAVEGDTLKIENNKVYLNGKELKEDYIKEEMFTNDLELTIPEGKIFVMGDNRNSSLDSRSNVIGLVDVEDELLGKASFSISNFKKL